MTAFSNKSKLHKWFCNFTEWVAPDPNKREDTKKRIASIREKIQAEAEKDGLTIMATPNAGSFAKKTGLRRHYLGKSDVEGQDVDLPFIVKPENEDGYELSALLEKFLKYTEACYDGHDIELTKSSIKLKFPDHFSVDIVPLLGTDDPEKQILIRSNGDRIETSIQKHVEFAKNRIKDSDEEKGRVLFNECVRLFKWWKEFQADDSTILDKTEDEDNSPPSFLIDLLCAKAYDEKSVQATYAETMGIWSSYLADIVRNRKPVHFYDYTEDVTPDTSSLWSVIDPVAKDNNIVKKWTNIKLDELADWFEEARDCLPRIISTARRENNSECIEHLVTLFGNPFKNHCE